MLEELAKMLFVVAFVASGTLAALYMIPLVMRIRRFSLRELLLGMALVAVALGSSQLCGNDPRQI
jgi:hypothetical protein